MKVYCIVFTILSSITISAQDGVTPGYDLDDSFRSPFTFIDKNKAESEKVTAQSQFSTITKRLKLLGVMKGANNTQIGLFNKGVVKVGETLSTMIGTEMVTMRLIKISTITMQATFLLGENEFTVGKDGGAK